MQNNTKKCSICNQQLKEINFKKHIISRIDKLHNNFDEYEKYIYNSHSNQYNPENYDFYEYLMDDCIEYYCENCKK